MTTQEILATEYSEEFDTLRKNRMVVSFHKYGPLKVNYEELETLDTLKNLEIRIEKYKQTGNTEYLVDAANYAMIEFMCPVHKKAHFNATDGGCEVAGMGH